MNTTKGYWKQYPSTVKVLGTLTGKRNKVVRAELAYIAGDHANMPDAEVVETFVNENIQPEQTVNVRIKL